MVYSQMVLVTSITPSALLGFLIALSLDETQFVSGVPKILYNKIIYFLDNE